MYWDDGRSVSSSRGLSDKTPPIVRPEQGGISSEKVQDSNATEHSNHGADICPFDICTRDSTGPVKLNLSLLQVNREKRRERELTRNVPQHRYLRPGMILLKNFISHQNQVIFNHVNQSSLFPLKLLNQPCLMRHHQKFRSDLCKFCLFNELGPNY